MSVPSANQQAHGPEDTSKTNEQQLVGTWIGAKAGGSDGLTSCGKAAANRTFARRQGNRLGFLRYDPDGRFRQLFVDENVDALVTTEGTWTVHEDVVTLVVDTAQISKVSDGPDKLRPMPSLEGSATKIRVRFFGWDVMHQSNIETGVFNRLVRCKW